MFDTINVYLLETTENLKWNHICGMQKYVSIQRQKRINKYRFERDRISSLVTALMTRMIISKNTGLAEYSLNFQTNKFGKPYLTNLTGYEFSISHTYRKSVFTDYNSSIGIDIETYSNSIKEYENIYRNNFTANEVMHINSSVNPFKEFVKIWTSKEAYVKMIGTGLSTPLLSFDVMNKTNKFKILTTEYKYTAISVCCNCNCKNITIIPVTLEELVTFYNQMGAQNLRFVHQ